MLHDPIDDLTLPARPRERSPRYLLMAGVAGAVALGVGAGLWARPAESERRAPVVREAAPQALAPQPGRQIEIVLDDSPAPLGAPIEVLPAFSATQMPADPQPPPTQVAPLAPVRPPAGLVRVQAVEPAQPPEMAPPPPRIAPRAPREAEATQAEVRKAEAQKARKAEARARRAKASAETARPAKAKALKAKPETAAPNASDRRRARKDEPKSKAPKAKGAAPRVEQAKAGKTKAERARGELAKAEKTRAKADKGKTRLATAGRRDRDTAETVGTKQPRALTRLGHARGKAAAHKAKAGEDTRKLAAKTERRSQAKAAKPKVEKAVASRTPKAGKPKVARGAGPLRVAKNDRRCVSADPGAALVCADPSLGAADRQMTRAYRDAEAAGVPAWQLRQQHQRWLAARSAAAREAPWAVQDVYSARIAELRDQARGEGSY